LGKVNAKEKKEQKNNNGGGHLQLINHLREQRRLLRQMLGEISNQDGAPIQDEIPRRVAQVAQVAPWKLIHTASTNHSAMAACSFSEFTPPQQRHLFNRVGGKLWRCFVPDCDVERKIDQSGLGVMERHAHNHAHFSTPKRKRFTEAEKKKILSRPVEATAGYTETHGVLGSIYTTIPRW
jgi:hypothetical protein